MLNRIVPSSLGGFSRSFVLALLVLMLAVPASASAIDPEQTVGGSGSQWISGDLLSQTGENCVVLGNPYTEVMVSGVASYGGTAGVPVVGQRYYTAFLVSVPGDPCGPGSSAIETDVVLPPHTTIDTSAPIRCFGQPRNASTFVELTGTIWSFNGSSGPYCPTHATPSALHSGGWSLGFRPLASGQLFQIFVPVISTQQLVGAGASPADGFRWLTDATGVYANPGLSTVWANVFPAGNTSGPFIYFAHQPAAIPFWKTGATAGTENRVELFANLYTAGHAGNLCWQIIRISDSSVRGDCNTPGVGWTSAVPGGSPDLFQVQATGSALGPNGGYAPVAFDLNEYDQDMKVVWTFTPTVGTPVTGVATFHTLPGPDSDGDGVPDAADACPATKGTLANGCQPAVQTDPDGDGVFGAADLCPTVNGGGALNGCPGGVVPPPKPPPPPPPPPVIKAPTLTHHRSSTVLLRGHLVVNSGLSVACPTGGAACRVVLAGTVSGSQARAGDRPSAITAKSVTIGTLTATVQAGKTLALSLRLSGKGVTLLRKHHSLRVALAGTAKTGTGPSIRLAATITITNPPPKKRRHH